MDGGSSAGNPSAASSCSLPTGTNEEVPQRADWVSPPEEGDFQSKELVSASKSQKLQSLAEEPEQLSLGEHTNHEDSPTEKQKPEDSSPSEDWTSPNDDSNSDQPKPEKAPAEPDQSKQDPPPTEQQVSLPIDEKKSKDSSSAQTQMKPDQNIPGCPNESNQNEPKDQRHHQEPPSENLIVITPDGQKDCQDPPTLNIQQDPPASHLNTQQAALPLHLNSQECPPPHLNTQQAALPLHLNAQQTPPPSHLNTQQAPPPSHLNIQHAPPPPQLNTQQTPPPSHLKTQQTPPPSHLNTQQAPPPSHLNTQQAPPPSRLNPQQASLPPHLNAQQAPPPSHLYIQQAPPPPQLNTQQTPPPSDLNAQQAPPPPHLNAQQAPPHLNTQQAPPPSHLNAQQAPPSPHLNTQEASPPEDQQNLSSLCPLLKVIPDEVSTLASSLQAPLLTTEVSTDQVQFCPPASPSGEPKLCGFLLKQGGPLKTWKLRWFMYEDKKNQLFYYRTPQDVMPLGRVELCSATFTYPLKAEKGTFHIKTPERTFVLKAVTQELMLYWLQQLQVKRWQHRQMSTCPNSTNSNTEDAFMPLLKSPLGLVGEEAANTPSQRAPLANLSIKHPLIEIQNSVHSLRKRSSQEWSPSVFHVETPTWTPPDSAVPLNTTLPPTPVTPTELSTLPPPVSLAEPGGQVSPVEGGQSPSLFESRSRKIKLVYRSLSNRQARRDTLSSSSDRMSLLQQEKQMLMEEIKAQKELVWILHKALEASQLEKRTCAEFLAETGEQERLELLRHRERQAADLRGQLEEAQAEAEALRRSLTQRDSHLAELQEEVRMLTEKNNAKQEVIIKLSDQVTTCMANYQPASSFSSRSDSQNFRHLQQEVENLKDDIEAYKTQNKFLNSELYQLTRLWRTSSEQEKSLMMKCAYLEASNCQMESRYLGVLRQLQETKSLDPAQRGAVQKMVEDALKRELKSVVKLHVARGHDEYGFKIIPEYEVEDMKLLAKIQALEIRSHNLLHQEGVECPLLDRWAQYLAGRSDDDLCASPELKSLLRGGIRQEYRQRMWRWMVRTRTRTIREHHPQCYQQLCEKSQMSSHPASRQIELDLHRTLTTNQHFSSPSSPYLQQLRRILLAFSWRNPAIGYCQGLNRLAAIALLVLQNEEDAFWCLVAVVEAIMPHDYYTKNLVASQADQRVLKDFLVEKLPRLAAHFEEHSVDVSLITFNWFLVIFVESLPSDILLPLWDAFLYEGTKVIFRYTLALFKYKENDILKIHDSVEIYQYLRFFTKTISDGRRLISIAFSDMNPFPRRLLRNRRALHLERLQGELQDLEEQQRRFITEHAERKDKELDTMVSEDDEEL